MMELTELRDVPPKISLGARGDRHDRLVVRIGGVDDDDEDPVELRTPDDRHRHAVDVDGLADRIDAAEELRGRRGAEDDDRLSGP